VFFTRESGRKRDIKKLGWEIEELLTSLGPGQGMAEQECGADRTACAQPESELNQRATAQ